jgi:2-(1,2-epoxy-1,2-dihydrophenyl)acetyl-CoA isomerase
VNLHVTSSALVSADEESPCPRFRRELSSTVDVTVDERGIATVILRHPPHNYIEEDDVAAIADALELATARGARAVVLASAGKNFCAGASLESKINGGVTFGMYEHIPRLFEAGKPIVAAVQGAAVGAGLGLALVADFRVTTASSRFVAPFTKLGFHHGFGLSVTLPRVVGHQRAAELLYTGSPVDGAMALRIGLADRLVNEATLIAQAQKFALAIARSAPLGVSAVRRTMRGELGAQVREALVMEQREQENLMVTKDFVEGVAAAAERREPTFTGN